LTVWRSTWQRSSTSGCKRTAEGNYWQLGGFCSDSNTVSRAEPIQKPAQRPFPASFCNPYVPSSRSGWGHYRDVHRWPTRFISGVGGTLIAACALLAQLPACSAAAAEAPAGVAPAPCTWNFTIDAITGSHGSASAIGWAGNHQGVVTCLGGSFYVQDGINRTFGFGLYAGGRTTWVDADGYLPAQVTSFNRSGARISITEFADRLTLGGHAYVAVYCRVAVANHGDRAITADPGASAGLISLGSGPDTVAPHRTAVHDYVVAVDRFGNSYSWPSPGALVSAGGFTRHFAHMRGFWRGQLAQIAGLQLPDRQLQNAYRSGFIDTQIARSGTHLNTGVNGYESEFSHDVVGILANLFTQGDFSDAHALLTEAREVVGSQGQYQDGLWTYSWPWAIYLLKTGDLSFVKANFSNPGPNAATEPSIEQSAHTIAADRTGPGGIMGATNDIDTDGLWTVDDYEALTGLAAYGYIAERVGDDAEALWATAEYNSLLSATNHTLSATISRYHLNYLPCSMVQPNTANRCQHAEDANWAAPFQFGHWAWDGTLFGVPLDGPGLQLIDTTYDYGLSRLRGKLPADTFGGFPSDYFSSAYNAGYGSWGLASARHRDQGILNYQFMIAHTQSGPYSWWESSAAPTASPWSGSHPASGQGSSPHAWGMAEANKVLLDSLVAQATNGNLIVGRGVPDRWLSTGTTLAVTNFPTTDGHRLDVAILAHGRQITLTLRGRSPAGSVLFQLPAFIDNINTTSAGVVEQATGTVLLPRHVRHVTIDLRRGVT
jgi:hypothetical protein